MGFRDDTIESKLRDKIFDSSVTIVLISKNMMESGRPESDQWIPWEISYSLREKTRDGRTSKPNAILAVVLPDRNGSYEYFVKPVGCPHCGSVTWMTNSLFKMLGKNMFNRKRPNLSRCQSGMCGIANHTGDDHSYIHPIRWNHFVGNVNYYIDLATNINENIDDYELLKVVPAESYARV